MSLSSTQSDIDAAVASLISDIHSAQATYFAENGKYWQGLISHNTIPADGSSVAADNLSATPTDQGATWDNFMGANKPGTLPAAVYVHVYKRPSGEQGYKIQKLFIYASAFYSAVVDSGSDVSVAWSSTPDTVAPTLPAPTYSSVSPTSGTDAGGTSITITGTGFQSGATVTVGGNAATSVTVVSSTSITCTTAAHAAGATDIVITNIDSQSATGSSAYTFTSASTPTYVRNGSGTASSTTDLSIAWAGGTAPTAGNVMIAIVQSNSGAPVASSNGWTEIQSGIVQTTCWYKIATGSDGAAAVWTWGGAAKADKVQGVMVEISGSNATTPIDVSAASSGTNVTPSVTTSTGTLVVSLGGGTATTAFATQPSGWSLGIHGSTHNGTGIAYKTFSSSGATGTASWTSDGTEVKVFTVAVKA